MRLPFFKDENPNFTLLQNQWSRVLNPLLENPLNNASILKNISLITGDNVINTRLGRKTQGWLISDINAPVQIYRNAPFNELTLTLNSSGAATVEIVVF